MKINSKHHPIIIKQYLRGRSTCQISKDYQVSDGCISYILQQNGVTLRKRGEANRQYTVNQKAFSEITPASCYWAGFLMADGNICNKGNNRLCITLELSKKDKNHLELFRKFLLTDKPLYYRKRISFNKLHAYARLEIQSSQIYHDLISQFGIQPNKTFTAKTNKDIINSIDFWRGMIDGDGWIVNGRQFSISLMGSLPIIKQYQKFLQSVLNFKYTIRPKGIMFYIVVSGSNAEKLGEILYSTNGPYLKRKKDKYESRLSQRV